MVDFSITAPNAALAGLAGFQNGQNVVAEQERAALDASLARAEEERANTIFGQQNVLFEQGQADRAAAQAAAAQAAATAAERQAQADAELAILQGKIMDGTYTPQDFAAFSIRYPEFAQDMPAISSALTEATIAKAEADKEAKVKADLEALGTKVGSGTATAQDFATFSIAHPDLAADMKSTWDGLAAERKTADSEMAFKAGTAIKAGRPDIAAKIFEDYAVAAENSNNKQDADLARAMAETIKEDPEAGLTTLGFMLQSIDPDANTKLFDGTLGAAETGLNLVYGTDQTTGETVVLQPTKNGALVASQLPENVKIDLSIKAEETARGKAVGDVSGTSLAKLPGAEIAVQTMEAQIKSLLEDPYLPSMLGSIEGRLPNVSESAARVQDKMNQLQGQAFLQAYEMLRGGGQITVVEGDQARVALLRAGTAKNEADYATALLDFQRAVRAGLEKMAVSAEVTTRGRGTAPAPTGGAPSVIEYDAEGNRL
jgi:hypothetical protein